MRLQCSPHHANSTLYPFVELLKHQLGWTPERDREPAELQAYLAQLGCDGELERAILANLVSGTDQAALATLTASQLADYTASLLARIVLAHARAGPAAVLVEDVHWADPTTIDLLQELVAAIVDRPVFLLMTGRPETAGILSQHGHVTSIRLARLPKSECNELIDRMTHVAPISESARSLILDKADGIPLFLEELTKLVLSADAAQLRNPAVPESLTHLLAAQLDKLGASRVVAQAASVIGRSFSYALLAAVCSLPDEEVEGALDQLVAAGVLVKEAGLGANQFSFRHALLRDAAYGTLLEQPRRALHYRVSSVLTDFFPEVAGERPEVVARHS